MLKFIYTNIIYILEMGSVLFTNFLAQIDSSDSYCTAYNKKIITIASTIHDLFSLYIVSKKSH